MAFEIQHFSPVGGQSRIGNSSAIWSYESTLDSLITVLADNYFDELATIVLPGDFINVSINMSHTVLIVATTSLHPSRVVIEEKVITHVIAFNPDEIHGLILWLDAANTDTITDNLGRVSQWLDKSGNNNHAKQVIANAQPLTGQVSINGLNTVTFAGGKDGSGNPGSEHMVIEPSSEILETPKIDHTILFVMGLHTLVNAVDCLLAWNASGGNNVELFCFRESSGEFETVGTGQIGSHVLIEVPPPLIDTTMLVSLDIAHSDFILTRLNGVLESNEVIGTVTFDSSRFTLCAEFDGTTTPGNFLEADICEILLYDHALALPELESIEAYLGNKWGISLG